MSETATINAIRLPLHDDSVPPVKIYDAEGRLVRIVPAEEFRGPRAAVPVPPRGRLKRRHD
ncbi:MAG TPA: hypothetical protein VGL09_10250 [Methylomirabilota bacterium]|jgi:hypothetical protein